MVKKKYNTLRFIATFLKVLAWLSLILSIISAIGLITAGIMGTFGLIFPIGNVALNIDPNSLNIVAGVGSGLSVLLIGLFYFIVPFAASEQIYLQIDTEHNTRATAELLEKYLLRQEKLNLPEITTEKEIPVNDVTLLRK
jgi:hypothetical protein